MLSEGGRKNLKVGLVTIGQSPRTDVTPTLREIVGSEVEFIEKGTLDGLTKKEIGRFAPTARDYVLVTRLRDETSVRVAKRHILPRIQKCIQELEKTNVDLMLLLCTGEFPEIKTKKLLIMPDKLISSTVWAIVNRGKLGVVVPERKQIPILRRKWKNRRVSLILTTANPYGNIKTSEKAATFLARKNVDLIVLDCIGFTPKTKELFRNLTKKPIILPQTILGRILKELVKT